MTSALINQNWNDITLLPVNPLPITDLFVLQWSIAVPWLLCCWLMDWTEKCWKGWCNSHNSTMLSCLICFKKKSSRSCQTMFANTCIVCLNYKAQQGILFSCNSLSEGRIRGNIRPCLQYTKQLDGPVHSYTAHGACHLHTNTVMITLKIKCNITPSPPPFLDVTEQWLSEAVGKAHGLASWC